MKGVVRAHLTGISMIVLFALSAGCTRAHGKDAVDDASKAKKTVNKFDWQPVIYDSTKKYIYLSFDDGPQHGTTTCVEICKEAHVKASFFMVGLHTAQKSDGAKIVDMIREGYPQTLLANHSYTHAGGKYLAFYHHPFAAEQDFAEAQDYLRVPYKISRLPGNRSWVREGEIKATSLVGPVAHLLDSAGYNVIGWDVEWHFNHKSARPLQTPEKLVAEVDSAFAHKETHVANHLVILSHDRMFQHADEAELLTRFIHLLKQNPAYVFETVDHYPGLKRPVRRG